MSKSDEWIRISVRRSLITEIKKFLETETGKLYGNPTNYIHHIVLNDLERREKVIVG